MLILRVSELGRSSGGWSVTPPINVLDDIWLFLDVRKRAMLFDVSNHEVPIRIAKIDRSISQVPYDYAGAGSQVVVPLFLQANLRQFETYLEICLAHSSPPTYLRIDRSCWGNGWEEMPGASPRSEEASSGHAEWDKESGRGSTSGPALEEIKAIVGEDIDEEKNGEELASKESVAEKADGEPKCPVEANAYSRHLLETWKGYEAADPDLVANMNSLPQELLLEIQDTFLRMVFVPKEIDAQSPDFCWDIWDALNAAQKAKCHDMFVNETLLNIGPGEYGPGDFEVATAGCGPLDMVESCKHMKIYFGRKDHEQNLDNMLQGFFTGLPEFGESECHCVSTIRRYDRQVNAVRDQLGWTWKWKWEGVMRGKALDYLEIDLTEAYGLDGEYLGTLALTDVTWREMPWYIRVRAPTDALAEDALDILDQ